MPADHVVAEVPFGDADRRVLRDRLGEVVLDRVGLIVLTVVSMSYWPWMVIFSFPAVSSIDISL